jgi:SAM-dependent methyltransferase
MQSAGRRGAVLSLDADLQERSRYAIERQEAIYAGASGLIWREAVYKRLHQGWELANLGGLPFLDAVVRMAQLEPASRVLELGSGAGAACQYLARVTGCRATGIERNDAQFERAQARSARSPEFDRLTFIHHDLTSWRDGDDFDAAFLLDTLSLLPDPGAALRTAVCATRASESRRLFVADLGAGPHVSHRILDRAFVEDGFCSLLDVDETKALMARYRFTDVTYYDHTDQAESALRSIVGWLDNPPLVLHAALPTKVVSDWRAVNDFYLNAFETRALEYRWWCARAIKA